MTPLPAPVAALDAAAEHAATPWRGGRIVWRAWGTGPVVVLLHGASGSWTHFVHNIPPLATRGRVLAPDMPGFGDSDLPPDATTAEALAEGLAAGVDALLPPPAPFDLAGFSFGGIVAGVLAARQGERVRRLVLLGPGGLGLPGAALPPLAKLAPTMTPAEATAVHRENLRRLMLADPARADDLAVAIHVDNVRRARFKSGDIPRSDTLLRALPHVRARLAGIWGERDVFAAHDLPARHRVLAHHHPTVDFRIIPAAGHWTCYERPDLINPHLLNLLRP